MNATTPRNAPQTSTDPTRDDVTWAEYAEKHQTPDWALLVEIRDDLIGVGYPADSVALVETPMRHIAIDSGPGHTVTVTVIPPMPMYGARDGATVRVVGSTTFGAYANVEITGMPGWHLVGRVRVVVAAVRKIGKVA